MKLSFATHTAGVSWSLEECADWARAHGFDAVRLTAASVTAPRSGKLTEPAVIVETLRSRGLLCRVVLSRREPRRPLPRDGRALPGDVPAGGARRRGARGEDRARRRGADGERGLLPGDVGAVAGSGPLGRPRALLRSLPL